MARSSADWAVIVAGEEDEAQQIPNEDEVPSKSSGSITALKQKGPESLDSTIVKMLQGLGFSALSRKLFGCA